MMETEKKHPENESNVEKNSVKCSDNWKSGVSSSIGAAVGVVAGSMAQPAFAADTNPEEESGTTSHLRPETTPVPDRETALPPTSGANANPEPAITPEPQPHPEPTPEPEITVVAYQTVTTDEGNPMDVAQILVDDQQALIVDVDQDGVADLLIADANADDTITENECIDISDATIQMSDLAQLAMNTPEMPVDPAHDPTLIADNGVLPDYTNNADVSGYMA